MMRNKLGKFIRQHKLRIYMVVVNGLIACVPLLIFGIVFYNATVNSINNNLLDNFNMTFAFVETNVDSFLENINTTSNFVLFSDEVLDILENDPEFSGIGNERMLRSKANSVFYLNSYLRDIYIVSNANKVGGSGDFMENKAVTDFIAENRKRIDENNMCFFAPDEGVFKNSVVLVRHINSVDDFRQIGLGVIVVNKQKLINSVPLAGNMKSSEFFVFDTKNNLIMFSGEDSGIAEEASKLSNPGNGIADINGKEYYFIGKSGDKENWRFVMLIPQKQLYQTARWLKYFIIILLLIVLPISATGTYIFNTSVVNQIKILSNAIDSVAKGNSKVRVHFKNYNEITSIEHNFNEMVRKNKILNRKIYDTQQRLYETELAKTKAELYLLQTQINSHFLYNTLGTIRAMAAEGDKHGVTSMISDVVAILRYAVGGNEFVPLKSEIDNLTNYMYIQKVRNNKIKFEVKTDIDIEQCYIQKLILQPIVENAIMHGINGGKKGSIKINITRENENVIIKVFDTGVGMSAKQAEEMNDRLKNTQSTENHIGLMNIQQRINMVYGKEYGISLKSWENIGTVARLEIPFWDREMLNVKGYFS